MSELKRFVEDNSRWITLLLIITVAFTLRIINISQKALYGDEVFTIYLSSQNISNLISGTINDLHPPFYYIVVKLWMDLFGKSNFSARFPSLIFNLGTISLIFIFCKENFGESVGVKAALISCFSVYYVIYSQFARMYSMAAFFCLFSVYFFFRILSLENSPKNFVGYLLVTAIAIYTHYISLLIILVQNLYVMINIRKFKALTKKWIALMSCLSMIFIPWITHFLQHTQRPRGPDTLNTALYKTVDTITRFTYGASPLSGMNYFLVFVILIIPILWMIPKINYRGSLESFLVLAIGAPILLSAVFSLNKSIPMQKVLIIISPYFYILLAVSIQNMGKKSLRVAFLAGFILLNLCSLLNFYSMTTLW